MSQVVPAPAVVAPEGSVAVRAGGAVEAIDAYVAQRACASGYHRPAWLGVIERAFSHETRYLVAEAGGTVAGVLPLVFFSSRLFGRFAVSIPFVNYGGIVADTPECARALLDAAIEETAKSGGAHLELRHTTAMCAGLPARRHKVAMHLPLEATVELQWARLDRKVRNQVRKAEKSGVQTEVGGAELLDAFYGVFARNMRDLGTPVYDRRFFEEILRTFPETTRIVLATVGGRPAAASLLYWHRGVIEVPWASAIRDFNALCVNVLLYWQMLQFAVTSGFRVFDFGRSTPGEGTFRFKQQWGAQPRELVWEYWTASGQPLPDLSPNNPKYRFAIHAWQRLPLAIATAVGPAIVRHIP